MSIMWLIYWLSFLIVASGGLALAYLEREDLNIKYAVVGIFVFSAAAIVPVLNTIVASDLLLRGTDKLTRQQISDKIDALKGEVTVSGSGTTLTIGIGNLQQELATRFDHVSNPGRENTFFTGQFFVNIIGNPVPGGA